MKKAVLVFIFLILAGSLIAALLELKSKNKEISLRNEEYTRARSDIEKLQIENKKIRTIASILNGATNGLHQTRPETIKLVNRAVEYIQQYKGPAEEKFKDCWNKRLNTTNIVCNQIRH